MTIYLTLLGESLIMKVVLINSVSGRGSTGKICVDIANEFIRNGDQVVIAYGWNPVPDQYKAISFKIGNPFSTYKAVFFSRLFDNDGFSCYHEPKKLLKFLDEYKPDLIWLHNLHGYYINVRLLFDWIRTNKNVAIKWTLHDCWSFTGHCAYFDFVGCEKWMNGCEKCPNKSKYPKSLLFDCSKKNYIKKKALFTSIETKRMTLISPSNWLANLIHSSFLKQYEIVVKNNTIDTNVFRRVDSDIKAKYGIKNKRIILGVASVWDNRKGLNDFLRLASIVNSNYAIVLIGLNKNQIKKLPKNIIGINKTENQNQIAEWYSSSTCFFLPTYEDNYPTVLLEAKACGCPTYSYDTGGCKEISDYIVHDISDFYNLLELNEHAKKNTQ